MTSGLNPAISRALNTEQAAAADLQEASTERAALDEAELHDVEQAEYYDHTATVTTPERAPAESGRSLIDRLFRRGSR